MGIYSCWGRPGAFYLGKDPVVSSNLKLSYIALNRWFYTFFSFARKIKQNGVKIAG